LLPDGGHKSNKPGHFVKLLIVFFSIVGKEDVLDAVSARRAPDCSQIDLYGQIMVLALLIMKLEAICILLIAETAREATMQAQVIHFVAFMQATNLGQRLL